MTSLVVYLGALVLFFQALYAGFSDILHTI